MYREIWVLMLSVGILMLIASLILFFIWGISDLIDELTGRKARRQIKVMHDMNQNSGNPEGYFSSDIYGGIPSGSLLSVDSGSIGSDSEEVMIEDESTSDIEKVEEIAHIDDEESTSFMEESETTYMEEDSTSFMEESETTYMSEDVQASYLEGAISIKILEEQSSL